MSDLDTLMQLRAWDAGHPLATAERLSRPRCAAEDTLLLAFVRMAGEALPWAFAAGAPGREPRVFTVTDPREQDAAASLALALGEVLLPHLGHPDFDEAPAHPALRQLWVPGGSHVDALHLLALRYVATKSTERAPALRRLGRAAGWLFRESRRAGQVRVLDATAQLRELFAFPCEPVRQQHLGYLLAWLESPADGAPEERRARALAAATKAEEQALSWTLDPELERSTLAPLLDAYHHARRSQALTAGPEALVRGVLEEEVLRRWSTLERAWKLLEADPRRTNSGLGPLVDLAENELEWQYLRVERNRGVDSSGEERGLFVPNPETDTSSHGGAARYWTAQYSQDLEQNLAHDDRWRFLRAAADGEALLGRVLSVRSAKEGRTTTIHWELECSAELPTKLSEGARLAVRGCPSREVTVLSVEDRGAARRVLVEVTAGKHARPDKGLTLAAQDLKHEGARVELLGVGMPELTRKKSFAAWNRTGPGAWLTDGGARTSPPRPPSPERERGEESRRVRAHDASTPAATTLLLPPLPLGRGGLGG